MVFLRIGLFLLAFLFSVSGQSDSSHIRLPTLGESGSTTVLTREEFLLGRAWLGAYRSRVPVHEDPLLQSYIERLTRDLAINSPLSSTPLELVVVKNPNLNAFAVPGGVIGIHTGLLLQAGDEHQMASVLGHELAHLSQRHYSRSVEAGKSRTLPTLAGMLAGLVLAATTGSDAGLAAITATQAAALDKRLHLSRQNEREADRIGLKILYDAGFDPQGASRMFEQMQRSLRFAGQRPPEFLLTHPITESRIADAQQRANQYRQKHYQHSLVYQFMQARVMLAHSANPQQAIKRFQAELESSKLNPQAAQYGLTLALIDARQWSEAETHLASLQTIKDNDSSLELMISLAKADILTGKGKFKAAEALLVEHYKKTPDNYPLAMALSRAYETSRNYSSAEKLLKDLTLQRPTDPFVWYHLAEVRGLLGNILGVHTARAEYFILSGSFTQASKQLKFGLKLSKNNPREKAILEERLKQIGKQKSLIEKL
ncbi:MAG: M48 family metalloprotease [Cellvibrionaceae bacterium]